MTDKRKPMTLGERTLLEANKSLMRDLKQCKNDIKILSSYIKGKTQLHNEVDNILTYYEGNNCPSKYDRRP